MQPNELTPRKKRPLSLEEARRNPEQNTTDRSYAAVDHIIRSYGHQDYYMSLTEIPKLGINPRSPHATPLGIYAYPLDDSNILSQLQGNGLPFAGDQPYINIFAPTDHIISLEDGAYDWNSLAHRISEYFIERARFDAPLSTQDENDILTIMGAESITKATECWVYSARVANWMVSPIALPRDPSGNLDLDVLKSSWTYAKTNVTSLEGRKRSAIIWNHIFRSLNIDGFVDHGNGIIHSFEPTQAVFFSTKSLRLVERLINPYKKIQSNEITINSPRDFGKVLSHVIGRTHRSRVNVAKSLAQIIKAMVQHTNISKTIDNLQVEYNPVADINPYINRLLMIIKKGATPKFLEDLGVEFTKFLNAEVKDYYLMQQLNPSNEQVQNRNILNRHGFIYLELMMACYRAMGHNQGSINNLFRYMFHTTEDFEKFMKEAGL